MVNSLTLESIVGEKNEDRVIRRSGTELGQCDTQGSKNKRRETSGIHCSRGRRMYLHFVFQVQGVQNPKVAGNGV